MVSVEGLGKYSSSYFITLTNLSNHLVYSYDGGGAEEHMFRVPVDHTFFFDTQHSSLQLQLYNKRRILGPTQLGWCMIPALDIGFLNHRDSAAVRYLSYRLRATDGCRSDIIINLSVKLLGSPDTCQTVIGIPVTAVRGVDKKQLAARWS